MTILSLCDQSISFHELLTIFVVVFRVEDLALSFFVTPEKIWCEFGMFISAIEIASWLFVFNDSSKFTQMSSKCWFARIMVTVDDTSTSFSSSSENLMLAYIFDEYIMACSFNCFFDFLNWFCFVFNFTNIVFDCLSGIRLFLILFHVTGYSFLHLFECLLIMCHFHVDSRGLLLFKKPFIVSDAKQFLILESLTVVK